MLKSSLAGLTVVLSLAGLAVAGDLRSPSDLESTAVLPKGVTNPRFRNIFFSQNEKFSGTGTAEPLGLKLNTSITFQDILNGQNDSISRQKVELLMQEAGLSANQSAGSTTGIVDAFIDIKAPIIGFGVTDDLTIAAAFPIVSAEIEVDNGFQRSAQGQAFINAAAARSEWSAAEASGKINDGVARKLAEYGYEPLRSQSKTQLGDVQIVSKYRISGLATERQNVTAKGTLTLPTGTPASPDRVVDASSGDARWGVGLGGIYDYKLLDMLTATGSGGANFQMPGTTTKRVPIKQGSSLSPDKEELTYNLTTALNTGAGLLYKVERFGLSFGSGYSFQYQTATTYRGGNRYDPARYNWLNELQPSQSLHSVTGSVGFSTIDFYRKKQFFYPFETKLTYSRPLAGRNAPTNPVVSGELVLFF